MDVYRPPCILRLPGISLEDYVAIEDVADARFLAEAAAGAEAGAAGDPADLPPDKIPRVFTGLDDWPLSTNLRCWVCDLTFDDRPKFVPTYVRELEGGAGAEPRGAAPRLEFGVCGNMCTFNCAELWIRTHIGGRASSEDRWRTQDNLCLLYFVFTGRHVASIAPAPPKTRLRQYGGDWELETFLGRMRELDPVAGLKDHTPGSVIPERERARVAATAARARANVGAPLRPAAPDLGGARVWGVCGGPRAASAAAFVPVPVPAAPVPAPAPAAPAPAAPAPAAPAPVRAPAPAPAARAPAPAAVTDAELDSLLAECLGPEPAALGDDDMDALIAELTVA